MMLEQVFPRLRITEDAPLKYENRRDAVLT